MTHEEIIDQLQDQVRHNRIGHKELERECEKWNIDLHEDVLEPIGYNTCERCDEVEWSDWLCWLDYREWDEDNPKDQALLKALAKEPYDYCGICQECMEELTKKGEAL